jgi:CheY-like chemotaxis protein
LPVIALTAGAFRVVRDAALAAGMNDFIAKPFDVEQMIALILHWTGGAAERFATASAEPVSQTDVNVGTDSDIAATLPDIDWPSGIALWRDMEYLRRYLNKFALDYGETGRTLADLLRQGELAAAAALAHKLKGGGGQPGAAAVAGLAGRMETQLQSGEPESGLAETLQAAIDAVRVLLTETPSEVTLAPDPAAAAVEQDSKRIGPRV